MTIPNRDIEKARKVNLAYFCAYKGLELKDENQGNFRVINHSGLIVKANGFYQFGTEKAGDSIEFCKTILKMSFPKAVKELVAFQDNIGENIPPLRAGSWTEKENKVFKLPKEGVDNKRVIAYLTKTRGLPLELINELIDKKLIYQDDIGESVFPCYDLEGIPRGAILRGTYEIRKGRALNSNGRYGWILTAPEESNEVLVTESPIDALSIITFYPNSPVRRAYILAMGGLFISSINMFLETHPQVDTIVLAVDKGEKAEVLIDRVKAELGDRYKIIDFRPPNFEDWNEELLGN